METNQRIPLLLMEDFKINLVDKIIKREETFNLFAQDKIGLVGPSGVGKTLFMKALALLEPKNEGRLFWKGKLVLGSSVPQFRSRVMYLQQGPVFLEGTVEENLKFPFRLKVHQELDYDKEKILKFLLQLHLNKSFLDKETNHLSGGEKQLLNMIRILQLDPEILLLDEPTSALDESRTFLFEQLIQNWCDENQQRSYVWITHSSQQMARVCSKREVFF